jgi:hypothetical protein
VLGVTADVTGTGGVPTRQFNVVLNWVPQLTAKLAH